MKDLLIGFVFGVIGMGLLGAKDGLRVHLAPEIEDALEFGPRSRPFDINKQAEQAALWSNSPVWGERVGLVRPWVISHIFSNGETPEFRLTIPQNEIWMIHRLGVDHTLSGTSLWQLHLRQENHPGSWANSENFNFSEISRATLVSSEAGLLLMGTSNTGSTINSMATKPGLLLSSGDQIRAKRTASIVADENILCFGLGESWLLPTRMADDATNKWTVNP